MSGNRVNFCAKWINSATSKMKVVGSNPTIRLEISDAIRICCNIVCKTYHAVCCCYGPLRNVPAMTLFLTVYQYIKLRKGVKTSCVWNYSSVLVSTMRL